MPLSRRDLLKGAAATTLGFGGLAALVGRGAWAAELAAADSALPAFGYGPLRPDPARIMDLPDGFSYTVFSRWGEEMDDGFRVPARHDGMAAFPGPDGLTTLVRNHELSPGDAAEGPFGEGHGLLARAKSRLYDAGAEGDPSLGGTTTLLFDTRRQALVRHRLSLAGTERNCAGGPTPWGTWITCEEAVVRAGQDGRAVDHGYNFEVPADYEAGLVRPVPLKAMGRMNHEAVAVDPASRVIYQTEDRHDGLIYRFLPNTPGRLADGGRLQALVIDGAPSLDTRNWKSSARKLPVGFSAPARWIDMDDVESPEDDLRHRGFAAGAARFARGEGMWQGNDAVYWACTNGGDAERGQVWKYIPSAREGQPGEDNAPGRVELFIEPNDPGLVDNADNLVVAPWGDLVLCEDGSGDQYLVGVTPEGRIYKLGRNALSGSELAGACFSPDGTTLFVNIQEDGLTLAITGPWRGAAA